MLTLRNELREARCGLHAKQRLTLACTIVPKMHAGRTSRRKATLQGRELHVYAEQSRRGKSGRCALSEASKDNYVVSRQSLDSGKQEPGWWSARLNASQFDDIWCRFSAERANYRFITVNRHCHLLLPDVSYSFHSSVFALDSMSLQIELVDPRPFYHPGEIFEGNIVFDSKKSEDIAQVVVDFTGRCKVKVRRHDHYTTVGVHPLQRMTTRLSCYEDLTSYTWLLLSNPEYPLRWR